MDVFVAQIMVTLEETQLPYVIRAFEYAKDARAAELRKHGGHAPELDAAYQHYKVLEETFRTVTK